MKKIKKKKIGNVKVNVVYPYKEKKFQFAKIKYSLSDYGDLNYQLIKFKPYDRFDNNYYRTIDVSELLYEINKKKKLKCNRVILFDFDKRGNILGIEIVNKKE